jgi:uncharacterized protein involved in response to NO
MDSDKPDPLTLSIPRSQQRDIFGLLGVGFYILFTLLPNGSSLLVSWPWVFIWQVALLLPWLWLLRDGWTQNQLTTLGYKLDYGMGLALVGLMGSTVLALFPQQARWYSWAALCAIAALYALNAWCESPARRLKLLTIQGGLSLAFIVVSLSLWISQTLLPELNRLAVLRKLGLDLPFDFSVLELRNWAPIGHQNYVAGYLVLSLPLLLGLSITSQAKWKWIWGLGVFLGLVDLYTTSSRGGWLGMAVIVGSGVLLLLSNRHLPLKWRGLAGLSLLTGLLGILLANSRLRSLFSTSSLDGTGGETAFRLITNTTGWAMGLEHPFFGVGPGGVPMLYQAYRPAWAGREAELVYQLHSAPAQIWAELGGVGIALSLGLVGWLGYWGFRLWRAQPAGWDTNRIFTWSLFAGLTGYGVVSITDYQLDIVCISGTLIVYTVGVLSLLRQYIPVHLETGSLKSFKLSLLSWGIVGLLIAIGIWLAPIHRAWQLSSLGFTALSQKQIEPFKNYVEQAHQLVPWESYYSYQLGWNLGPLKTQNENAQVNQTRLKESLEFFTRNVKASPNQESGTSSLGWLQLFNRQSTQATTSFLKSTQLIPAKHGGFHSLGVSLLEQKKVNLGIQALALEIVRDPLWLSSPLWHSAQYASVYPQVQNAVVQLYQHLLQNRSSDSFTTYLHQCLGGVYWWQGKLTEADAQWRKEGPVLGQSVLAIAQHNTPSTDAPILKAWLDPQNRTQWIEKALLQANKSQPDPKLVQEIRTSMDRSKTLEEWVKQNAPTRQSLRERTGFGVLSRHIDGPAPSDFFPMVENVAMTQFFADLLPSNSYSPDLDTALQPFRKQLWESITRTQPR